ncbi:MAG: putative zinc-binding metallopeptidase [bacterium]|jgi:hypothetical protein|nr:hypothetical protein [Planctomycetota bacterium]HIL51721.1 hypothetical protein [Planctomycetota bacterium]
MAVRRLRPRWAGYGDERLLELSFSELGLDLAGSTLRNRLDELQAEFQDRGFCFRPYAWLSSDWFTPDHLTGFAMPFYLAHPRLMRLERRQMLEVEGGTRAECLKIMRHETAHAMDNAYGLRRRKRWRELFGRAGSKYAANYTPDPTSRDFVLHLDYWYSQSHPLEDWAETFAVWLQPGSRWRTRYAGWPAIEKLEYVDALMQEIVHKPPAKRTRGQEDSLGRMDMTLGEYYERKHAVYSDDSSPALDGQLCRVFPRAGVAGTRFPRAATFLRRHRRALVRSVAAATGQHRYLLDHVVREMIERCKSQDLRVSLGPREAQVGAAIVLTSLSSQFLFGAHPIYRR